MEIRRFLPGDQPAVIALWTAVELVVPWNDPDADIATYLASEQNLFFIAEDRHALVGTAMAGFDGHRGWIYYLAVAETHRHSGIGRALVERCERELRARGCPKLNLMVREDNHEASAFYAKLGYERSSVRTLGRRLD